MSQEDGNPTDEQRQEAERRDPVGDANEDGVV
jgi:hypothetical protein